MIPRRQRVLMAMSEEMTDPKSLLIAAKIVGCVVVMTRMKKKKRFVRGLSFYC
jgi:hypothetical protein